MRAVSSTSSASCVSGSSSAQYLQGRERGEGGEEGERAEHQQCQCHSSHAKTAEKIAESLAASRLALPHSHSPADLQLRHPARVAVEVAAVAYGVLDIVLKELSL